MGVRCQWDTSSVPSIQVGISEAQGMNVIRQVVSIRLLDGAVGNLRSPATSVQYQV